MPLPRTEAVVSVTAGSGDTTRTGSGTAGEDGTFSIPVDLASFAPGSVPISAIAKDATGNIGTPATTTASRSVAPGAPAAPTAQAGDGTATVTFTPPSDGNSPITGYVVRDATTGVASGDKPLAADTRSYTFTNLVNGSAHSFTVEALNANGTSGAGAASAPVTPRFLTRTYVQNSVASTVSGTRVYAGGFLVRSDNTGIDSQGAKIVKVVQRYDNGSLSAPVYVPTDSRGYFVAAETASSNAVFLASYAGDAADQPVAATSPRMLVAPKVTVSSPASGASGSASKALVVTGKVAPNKAGSTVSLYRVLSNGQQQLLTHSTLTSSSAYRLSKTLARGTYSLVVRIASTSGNAAGTSARFTVRRT